jgi:hypothetical protein
MPTVSDELLRQIATRVAQKVHSSTTNRRSWPERYLLLVLSGGGSALEAALDRLAATPESIVAVADCPSATAEALAAARARIPAISVVTDEPSEVESLVAHADSVLAPAMDLALASRVASLQTDTPGARVLVRALLRGVRVEATLDDREFRVSEGASDGARRAVEQIESRLRAIGLVIRSEPVPVRVAAAAASSAGSALATPAGSRATVIRQHPSQDRFELPRSVDEFVDFLEQKGCSIEPGKPCIDCGACEARGF